MAEMTSIEKAKAAVAELLQHLGIEQVFCIDDIYAQEWKLEDLQAAQLGLNAQGLLDIMPEFGAAIPTDRDVRRQEFRKLWEGLEFATQQERGKQIIALSIADDAASSNDYFVATALQDIVGTGRLVPLSPAAWEKQEPEVIKAAGAHRVIVLFDQDLSNAGGSQTGGMALVKNLLAKDTSGNLLCGLLTHTATMADQHERWEALSQEPGVDRDRFLVVPKEWLRLDPMGFARMLKLVALSTDCQKLKTKIKAMLDSALAEAAKQVDGISVFDFDHVVFRAAYEEGMWEPDMLFRLHAIFSRTELRKQSHSDKELAQLLERPRKVSLIPTDSESAPAPSSWRLQQQEMYDSGEYINTLHLPIEIGDIFQKADGKSTKSFILVGQPCDLMVRSNGERAPEITDVVLAEVSPSDKLRPYTELLPCFGDDPAAKHYVMFRRIHMVAPCVLDLCVFNADGTSIMDLSTPCPAQLTPSWRIRFEVVRQKVKSVIGRYAKFADGKTTDHAALAALRQEAIKAFPPSPSNSGLFKGTVELAPDSGRVSFNCKRVRRLCRQRATALALQYAACMGRPAFDRELQ